mgnify:CR=1 FL=1
MDSITELKNKLEAYSALPSKKVAAITNYLFGTAKKIEDDIANMKRVHAEELNQSAFILADKLARSGGSLEIQSPDGYILTLSATKVHPLVKNQSPPPTTLNKNEPQH